MTLTTSLLANRKQQRQKLEGVTAGFTLLELLMVVMMVGILAVIGSAGYLGWMTRLRVNAAQSTALNVIREAQIRARQQNTTWQASFQNTTNSDGQPIVQWAVHSAATATNPPFVPTGVAWQTIEQPFIQVDTENTSLVSNSATWRVRFDHKGQVVKEGNLGVPVTITLTSTKGGPKRCVIVKTLLGAVSTATDSNCNK
ncbi:pilus assembly FimT family protein [Microcoleus sp. FACHB-672]|uniref:pilus assembly FimT family protein n=1 Tax=Microcoleus sp. FACHB-672 TaxID=2692825 RepID=UPI0016867877|nr:type II secretion system protein [Microcoleus sp. FACHB-672]MBD2040591.1 type II secretion system protein [Microcoleus sp. FACHB-672]